jgi:hypothetical protein
MVKHILALVAAAALVGSVGFVQASGPSGGGGGGSGGGGSTVRYVGYVTGIVDTADGTLVTIGTSYYNTGTMLVTPSTRVAYYNSNQNATVNDIDFGDYVEIAATSAGVAVRVTIVIP